MDRLLNTLTLLSIGLLVLVLGSVRRAHIRVEYSVSWLVAAVTLLVVSRSPHLLLWVGAELGIESPPVALLLLALCVFLVVFYRVTVTISELKDANIALCQRIAILEFYRQGSDEKGPEPTSEESDGAKKKRQGRPTPGPR